MNIETDMNVEADIVFDELLLSERQNGYDCGFIALGVDRNDIVQFMLENAGRLEIRQYLSLEILNFFMIADTKGKGSNRETQDLLQDLFTDFESADSDLKNQIAKIIQEVLNQPTYASNLHGEFSNLMSQEADCIQQTEKLTNAANNILGLVGPDRRNSSDLVIHQNPTDKNSELNDLITKIFQNKQALDAKFQTFANRQNVYEYYVKTYYQERGWLAFQRNFGEDKSGCIIDLIAYHQNCQVFVWTPKSKDSETTTLTLICRTKNQHPTQPSRHILFKGNNHFTRLEIVSAPDNISFTDFSNLTGIIRPSTQNNPPPESSNDDESDVFFHQEIEIPRTLFNPAKFDVATDNFHTFVKTSVFVDKSLFIAEFLEGDSAVLITRPRRWGKTLNLRMLEVFLEVNVDRDQDQKPKNRFYFEGGRDEMGYEYKKLKIAYVDSKPDPEHYMRNYQSQYPTIFLNLKDVTVKNIKNGMQEVTSQFKQIVSRIFKEKQYLMEFITPSEQTDFQAIMARQGTIEPSQYLPFLAELLRHYHNKQVYLLVDEYDRGVNNLLQDGDFIKSERASNYALVHKVAKFVSDIISPCCKGNPDIAKVVITGVYDTLVRSSTSGVNNITSCGIDGYQFSTCFGFSKEEIDDQLLDCILVKGHEKYDTTKKILQCAMLKHYNGYNLISPDGPLRVYVAYSVLSYIRDIYILRRIGKKPKSFWNITGGDDILRNLPSLQIQGEDFSKLLELVQRRQVTFARIPETFRLIDAFNPSQISTQKMVIIYILLNCGYVTKVPNTENDYKIPNQEVCEVLGERIMNALADRHSQERPDEGLRVFCDAVALNLPNAAKFTEALEKLLEHLPFGEKNEAYFQCLIAGGIIHFTIYASRQATHSIAVELYVRAATGDLGKIDNIFYPLRDSTKVIIHEYKVTEDVNKVEKELENALWQICLKSYMMDPLCRFQTFKRTFDTIELRGIVFIRNKIDGKWNCRVQIKQLSVENAQKIVDFFQSSRTDKLRSLFKKNKEGHEFNSERAALLKTFNVNNWENLVSSLISGQDTEKMQVEDNDDNKGSKGIKTDLSNLLNGIRLNKKVNTDNIVELILRNKQNILEMTEREFEQALMVISMIGNATAKKISAFLEDIRNIVKKYLEPEESFK